MWNNLPWINSTSNRRRSRPWYNIHSSLFFSWNTTVVASSLKRWRMQSSSNWQNGQLGDIIGWSKSISWWNEKVRQTHKQEKNLNPVAPWFLCHLQNWITTSINDFFLKKKKLRHSYSFMENFLREGSAIKSYILSVRDYNNFYFIIRNKKKH